MRPKYLDLWKVALFDADMVDVNDLIFCKVENRP